MAGELKLHGYHMHDRLPCRSEIADRTALTTAGAEAAASLRAYQAYLVCLRWHDNTAGRVQKYNTQLQHSARQRVKLAKYALEFRRLSEAIPGQN